MRVPHAGPLYSRDKPRDANCAHNAAERYDVFDSHLCFHFYQCVVPKVGDSAWNGNYVGSSPITLTILKYTVVLLIYINDNNGCVKLWGGSLMVKHQLVTL